MEVLRIVIVAVLGGVGGAFLGRWLSRARPRLSLISIKKGRGEEEPVEVPRDIVTAVNEFYWVGRLPEIAKYGGIVTIRQQAKDFLDKKAPVIEEAAGKLSSRVQAAVSREEKMDVLGALARSRVVVDQILYGLREKELCLSPRQYSGGEQFFETTDTGAGVNLGIVAALPKGPLNMWARGTAAALTLKSYRPFVSAMQYFDQDVLRQCLSYAQRAVQRGIISAESVISKLDGLLQSEELILEVAITNHGDRLAVLSPYAALSVRGAGGSIAPLALRATGVRSDDESVTEISELSAYIAVDPQSVKKYVFVSDPLNGSPLGAAYEAGLLDCRVTATRESGRAARKKVVSPRVTFGAGLGESLRRKVIDHAQGS